MSVRPAGPGKWWVDWYPKGRKGKREQRVFYGSEAEARAFEAEVRKASFHAAGVDVNPKIIDIIPEYLEWLRNNLALRTYEDVKKSLRSLMPIFGHLKVTMITPTIIDRFKSSRAGKLAAQKKELNYLKGIITWMVKRGYCNPLPFRIEMPRYKRPVPQIPHPTDIEKFLNEIHDPRKKALILFMWECGLRYNDAARLRWEAIDWTHGSASIIQKGGERRLVLMTDAIQGLLLPHREGKGWVFENPTTGEPVKSLKNLFRAACRRAGIRTFSPHKLRFAAGTYLLEATGDLRLVQSYLGHKDIATTQIYTQIATNRLRDGMEKAAHYISELKRGSNGVNKPSHE